MALPREGISISAEAEKAEEEIHDEFRVHGRAF